MPLGIARVVDADPLFVFSDICEIFGTSTVLDDAQIFASVTANTQGSCPQCCVAAAVRFSDFSNTVLKLRRKDQVALFSEKSELKSERSANF